MAVSEARFLVVTAEGNLSVRDYDPILVAQVTVPGSRAEALSRGFQQLADFIFGNTKAPDGNPGGGKIAMTAPVLQVRTPAKIPSTASVLQTAEVPGQWLVRFVMPADYSLNTLPRPNNPAVRIIEQPAERLAVLCFSGLVNDDKLAAREAELGTWVKAKGWSVTGPFRHAYYNPPWTLPWWRRNEVMLPLQAG